VGTGDIRIVIHSAINKRLTGFTILELLVVIAIIAMIAAGGIVGLIVFRQSVQLQEATSSFVSNLRTAQNMARNSNLSEHQVRGNDCGRFTLSETCRMPDAFAIYFDSDENYSLMYCIDTTIAGNPRVSCGTEQSSLKPNEFNSVTIYPDPTSQADCMGIVFERLTGSITSISIDNLAEENHSGECVIRLTNEVGNTKEVVINLAENSIKQQ